MTEIETDNYICPPPNSSYECRLSITNSGLVYVGKIISIEGIPNADFIQSATVVCGKGGKWRGIVKKDQFIVGDICDVYLPDSLIPPNEGMKFMESSGWRVKMRRFKGAPSEVLIMPIPPGYRQGRGVGDDMTSWFGVTKYMKPIPTSLQGDALGDFPSFIPKTDEPNYQSELGQQYLEKLQYEDYYVTEKADGSSTTAYKYRGHFGICSRNLELKRNKNNGYWKVAIEYDLENKLPEGIALQWETCGPKIQSNPHGFNKVTGLAFSAYDIENQKYLTFHEFFDLCRDLDFPTVRLVHCDDCFYRDGIETLGEGTYSNGKQREGVVVRSALNLLGHKPISFKVINLNYER